MKSKVQHKMWILFFLILNLSETAYSESKILKDSPKASLRDTMHELVGYLSKAKAFSQAVPSENKNDDQAKVEDLLVKLKDTVNKIDPKTLPSSEAYPISLKALQQHFTEIERLHRYGNQHYSRWMLNATTTLCIMCHTQTPSDSRSLSFAGPYVKASTAEEKFAQAEFLFTTRQFDQAIKMYNELIAGFPKNGLHTAQLDTMLRHQVAYFARVKRAPLEGMNALADDAKNSEIPEALRKNLRAWEALFRKWSKEKDPQVSSNSQDVLRFVKKEMKKTLWDRMIDADDPRVVTYLRVSGVLYNHLFSETRNSDTAEILLWLGRCEASLNNMFFYSLGDLYFRECIESFSSNPVAKECYKELETSMKKAYMTTTESNLPPFIEMELKAYRAKLGLE